MVDLTYQQSVQPDALPGRAAPRFPDEAAPQDYGSAVGQGLENLGSAAEGVYKQQVAVADHAAKVAEAQAQQTQLGNWHNNMQSQMLTLLHDPKTGALAQQGQNAFGLTDKYLPQWDAAQQASLDAIPNPTARTAAAHAAGEMRNQFVEQLDSHELQQHNVFADQTDRAGVRLAQQVGPANYNNAGILATNRDNIIAANQNMGMRKGWSDDEVMAANQEDLSKFHIDTIDRMATDGKFQMAQHYLDASKSDMDASTAFSAQRMITAALKEKQDQAKFDIQSRLTDSMQGAEFGLNNPVNVSRNELNLLYEKQPGRAQRVWDGLQSMVETGAATKTYNQMTAQQVDDDVKSHMPTEGGMEAGLQIKSYEMRARAAEQSIKQRQADPAQFAVNNNGWQPIDLSKPQAAMSQLQYRFNTQSNVSSQIGIPVPILTKQENQQLGTALNASPPDQKLQLLSQVYSAAPDERHYFGLLNQVAEHSPVTAIVGAKIQPPNPAASPTYYDSKFAPSLDDAKTILTGENILNPQGQNKGTEEKGSFKNGFPMPQESGSGGMQATFADMAKDTFRDRPELADAHYSAFRDAYAALASQAGKLDGVPDSKLVKQAFQMAVGTPVSWSSGNEVIAPPGMDPTRLKGIIQGAVQDAAKTYGAPADWKDRISGYQLRETGALGSGQYVLRNGNVDLVRPDGKGPFTIDLKQQFARNREWSEWDQ